MASSLTILGGSWTVASRTIAPSPLWLRKLVDGMSAFKEQRRSTERKLLAHIDPFTDSSPEPSRRGERDTDLPERQRASVANMVGENACRVNWLTEPAFRTHHKRTHHKRTVPHVREWLGALA
jgi:hypothetical protein